VGEGDDQRVERQEPVPLAAGGVGRVLPELPGGLAEPLGGLGVVTLEEGEDGEGEGVLGPVVGVARLHPRAQVVGHLPGGGQLALEEVVRVHAGQGGQVLGPRAELAAELGAAGEVLPGLLGAEAAGRGGGDAPLEPATDLQQVPDARVGDLGDQVEGVAVALQGLGDGPASPGLIGAGQDRLVGVEGAAGPP
jgi:hypothetical protein